MRENRKKKKQKKKQEKCNRKTQITELTTYIYLVLDESIPSTHKNYQETKYETQTQMHRAVDYMPHGEKPIQHQAVDPSKDYSAQG